MKKPRRAHSVGDQFDGGISVPPQIDPDQGSTLDLVCILDCIGDPAIIQARVALLRDIVDTVGTGYSAPGGVRLGVVGYADTLHVEAVQPSSGLPPPLQVYPLAAPETVLDRLTGLATLTHREQDYPGLLEEALDALLRPPPGQRAVGWRPGSARAVLFLGDRPPHPSEVGAHRFVRSPRGLVWEERLTTARKELRARAVAVRWPTSETWPRPLLETEASYAEQCWRTLGADGLFGASAAALDEIALALDPSYGQQVVSLPLPIVAGGVVTLV